MSGIRSFLQPTSSSLSGFIYDAFCIKMSGTVCSLAAGLRVSRSPGPWGASILWAGRGGLPRQTWERKKNRRVPQMGQCGCWLQRKAVLGRPAGPNWRVLFYLICRKKCVASIYL